jgi:PIN domain nuclease of toxin-antitoxin system
MNSPEPVLDASAFLAYLQAEDGAALVGAALARGCTMSSVNWAEVLSKVAEFGKPPAELVSDLESRQLLGTSLRIVPFDYMDALIVGDLRPATRALGLSLGDRTCLALGKRLGSPVLTSDHAWGHLDSNIGIEVQLIR